MFESFVRRTVESKIYKGTYLDDLKHFEFGPIFIGSNRYADSLHFYNIFVFIHIFKCTYYYRTYEEKHTIDLKNSSLIIANIDIEFLEDTTIFQLDKTFLSLEVKKQIIFYVNKKTSVAAS